MAARVSKALTVAATDGASLVESDSVYYEAAMRITSRALGRDISRAVGAIDPAVFTLINLIAEWIMKIIALLQERFNNDPEQIVEALRRPGWREERKLYGEVYDRIPVVFRRLYRKVAQEMLTEAARIEEQKILAGLEELDFISV